MRIGIDVSSWLNHRGQGRFAQELIRALLRLAPSNQYWLFLDAETARLSNDLPEGRHTTRVIVATSQAATRSASTSGHRTIYDLWAMVRAARRYRSDIDLFYFPSAITFFPLWRGAKVILTIHDAIPNKYPDLIFARRRNRILWDLKLKYAIKQADLIATVSESAKQDIVRAFRVNEDRVTIIPAGVGCRRWGFHLLSIVLFILAQ